MMSPRRPIPLVRHRLRQPAVSPVLAAAFRTAFVMGWAGFAAAQDMPAPDAAGIPNPNPLSAIDPASLIGFRDRPLFSPDRTRPPDPVTEPAPDVVEPPAEQPPEPVTLQLLGVIGTPDGVSALVRDESDDTRHVLRAGDSFRGWSVVSVDGQAMVLDRDGETMRLPTFKPPEEGPEGDRPDGETELMPELEGSGTTP